MTPLSIDEVLKLIQRLPSLPTVVMDLLATMEQDNVDIDTLARKIAQDQALTAKTLRLANSSFYGRSGDVGTMAEAIAVLGFRTVRSIVTTAGLMQSLNEVGSGKVDLIPFWRHAIGVAVCARELAPYSQVNPDQAFTAGLLHDIGRLVLVTQFAAQHSEVEFYRHEHDCSALEAEQAVLGIDHAVIGQALTVHWKFPSPLQRAVGLHHAADIPAHAPLALIVAVANSIIHTFGKSGATDEAVSVLPAPLCSRLGLESETLLRVFTRVEKNLEAYSKLLEI